MAFHYAISRPLDLVYICAEGDLHIGELAACVGSYVREPAFHSGTDVFVEARESGVEVRFDDEDGFKRLCRLIEQARDLGIGYRVACASTDQDFCELILAIADEAAAQIEADTFETPEEALRWLRASAVGDKSDEHIQGLLGALRDRALAPPA